MYDITRIPNGFVCSFPSCEKARPTRFLDTMSLHMCVSGMTSLQRLIKKARESESVQKRVRDHLAKSQQHHRRDADADEDVQKFLEDNTDEVSFRNWNHFYEPL